MSGKASITLTRLRLRVFDIHRGPTSLVWHARSGRITAASWAVLCLRAGLCATREALRPSARGTSAKY